MADGNLGDLSFSLTLKARLEEETKKVLQVLNGIDATGRRAQDVLNGVAQAVNSIGGKDVMNMEKLRDAYKSLSTEAASLRQTENIVDAVKIEKAVSSLERVLEVLGKIKQEGYGMTGATPAFSPAELRVEEILQQRRHAKEQNAKKEAEIEQQRQEKMKQSAQAAQDAYNQEIRAAEEASRVFSATLKRQIEARSAEYDRQKRQQEMAKADRDAELKAMSDYAKRYMELQEAKRKADEKTTAEAKKKSEQRAAQIEKDTRKMSELYSILGVARDKAESVGMKGLALNVDTSNLETKLRVVEDLMNRIYNANPKTLGLGGRATSEDYATEVKNVKRALDEATRSQKELNRAQEQANKTAKRETEKQAAQEARDAANAEKQRQNEIKKSESRYDALDRTLVKLKAEAAKSIALNVDTTKIDAKIHELESKIQYVTSIMNQLKGGDLSAIGQLGNIGTGRDLTLANRTLQSQKELNAEKQKSVQLEQKHQQEVAKTAATVRNDLVKAFQQAKEHTGSMNGALQDMKSLLMQGGIVYGAQQFLMSIIQTGGELERQHIALQSILGDMQNADTMYSQIKQLALASPFTFSELNKDVKQLAAYGVEYDELYDTTKRLADMASGLGVSFERIALAFGQVQARGWLDGKELRQISYAGIPLLDKLSKMYSQREGQKVTSSEVKTRISSRQVSFEDVKSVFWDMTDAGGQFYNMQQTLSETLLGRYNKLKDAWEIMLSDFASGTSKSGQMLMGVLDTLTSIVQAMHTLGPVMLAAFSGFAIKKLFTAQGGNISSFLGGKASMADEYTRKLASGQQLTQIERNLLATKNQITGADLRSLAAARALTTADLDRLRISGMITAEQYKIYGALVRQQAETLALSTQWTRLVATYRGFSLGNMWANFSTMAMSSFRIIKAGAMSLGSTLWAAIGGLPGLLVTGAITAFTYISNKNAELKQEMDTVANELRDRYKSIKELLRDTPAFKIITDGDIKEIDNAIDTYKEKIKQIAPYDYSNLVMKAEERKSHEERLAYLSDELKLIERANKIAQNKLGDSSTYEDLKDALEKMSDQYDVTTKESAFNTSVDESKRRYTRVKGYGNYYDYFAKELHEEITDIFGDLSKNQEAQSAAKQAMSSILAQMEVPEDKANVIRASVMQSFGLVDGWLKDQVGAKMSELISNTSPLIANKIRSGQSLNDAEKAKVQELMTDAKHQLIYQYPEVERTLQNLLANSRFEATINLVIQTSGKLEGVQKVMSERLGNTPWNDKTKEKMLRYVNSWGKTDSWYDARNAAQSDIKAAWNNYLSSVRSNAPKEDQAKRKQDWEDAVSAARELLNYNYTGDDAKSNKNKKDNGRKYDKELKAWQSRLDAYKSARQTYQKWKEVMGKEEAKKAVGEHYDNIAGLDLDNYEAALRKLEKELDFSKSPERKKALTSLKRELADWRFSEVLKPEMERAAEVFREALENAVSRFSLYDELKEKTGDKAFAMNAFNENGQVWTDVARNLAAEYAQRTGRDAKEDAQAPDAELEELLKNHGGDPESYELIKQIKSLLSGSYVDYLKAIAETRSEDGYQTLDEQLAKVNAKYEELINAAIQLGDSKGQRLLENKRGQDKAQAEFNDYKKGTDYAKFFSTSIRQGVTYLKQFSDIAKSKLNKALLEGGITAEEYAQELEKINSRMRDTGSNFSKFGGGGLNQLTSGLKDIGKQTSNDGVQQYESYKRAYNQAMSMQDKAGMETAQNGMNAAQSMISGGEALSSGAGEMEGAIAIVDTIIHGINDIVQGMYDTFQDIKETAEALGTDTDSDSWTDANTFFSSFSNASNSATSGWDSLKEGNIGGVISGVVGSWTGWIKGFAQGYDKKIDNHIKIAERQEKLLQNISSNVEDVVSNTLGGIYGYKMTDYTRSGLQKAYERSSKEKTLLGHRISKTDSGDDTSEALKKALTTGEAYDAQLAALLAQRDEIETKLGSEKSKKDSDADKIADYEKEQEDLRLQIENFTTNWLSSNYGVDLKNWASQLTDALVEAWATGEDAADAYFDTVNDLMKSLAKKIISQSILEANLKPVLTEFESLLQDGSGKLDKNSLDGIWKEVMQGMDSAVEQTESFLDYVKSQGLDLSENGSLSTSNSIKSVTEETADLLASYINAIRLDVSVNRANIQTIAQAVSSLPEMNTIARSQLAGMNQLISLAEYRNGKLDEMYDWMRATTTGTKKLYIA